MPFLDSIMKKNNSIFPCILVFSESEKGDVSYIFCAKQVIGISLNVIIIVTGCSFTSLGQAAKVMVFK